MWLVGWVEQGETHRTLGGFRWRSTHPTPRHDRAGRPAARFDESRRNRQRKGLLLARAEEARDRHAPPVGDQKQPFDAELAMGFAVELDPYGIEFPFGDGAAMADLAKPQFARRHHQGLVGGR